jgi:thiamine-phosphate pyrophosphorylase
MRSPALLLGQRVPCEPKMTDGQADRLRAALRLFLLADPGLVPAGSLAVAVEAALRGGVTAVQLRSKDATIAELLELARTINALCRERDVPLIVNERVDVALAAEADGAHVGQIGEEEESPTEARRLLGSDAIVGVSVTSPREARQATSQGASYISAGPMFNSAGELVGEELLRHVRAATRLPLVVIGGITAQRAGSLYAAGADGVCVGAAILRAGDVEGAARAFAQSMGRTT